MGDGESRWFPVRASFIFFSSFSDFTLFFYFTIKSRRSAITENFPIPAANTRVEGRLQYMGTKGKKGGINIPSCHTPSLSSCNLPFEDFYGFTLVRSFPQTSPSLPCRWASVVSLALSSLDHLPFLWLSMRAESSLPCRCTHGAPFFSLEPLRGQLQSGGETVEVLPVGTLPVCEWVSGLPGPVITSAAHLSSPAPGYLCL